MKTRILFMVVLGLWLNQSNAQSYPFKYIQNTNFFSIKNLYTNKYNEERILYGDSLVDAEGSDYTEFKRWINFWEPRLAPSGDFKAYFGSGKNFQDGQNIPAPGNTDPWEEIGPTIKPQTGIPIGGGDWGVGPIEFISFYNPNPSLMLCGSLNGGLFYSGDGGDHWQNGGSDTKWQHSGCSWATFAPNSSSTWYASSSGYIFSTGGIFRTTNSGSTWDIIADQSDLGNPSVPNPWNNVLKLLVDPMNPNVMYAATSDGIYKSTNINAAPSSVTWVKVYTGLAFDIEFKPGASNILYASVKDNITGIWSIIQSTNSGSTWPAMPGFPSTTGMNAITLEVTPANSSYIYAIYTDLNLTPNDKLYRYDGTSWVMRSSNHLVVLGSGNAFCVSPSNAEEVYISGGSYAGIYYAKSTNGGSTFTTNYGANQFHVDLEDIICDPATPGKVWMATHGGTYISLNSGVTWTSKTNGQGVAEVKGYAESYNAPDYIAIGTYHDGSSLTNSPYISGGWNPVWKTAEGGDGQEPLIDYTNYQNVWLSYQFGSVFSSDYYTTTKAPTCISNGLFETHIAENAVTPATCYGATVQYIGGNPRAEIRRSFNYGTTACDLISQFSSVTLTQSNSLCACPYANMTNYGIWKIYSPKANGNYLYVHVYDDTQVPLSSNYRVHRLFRTTIVNDPNLTNVINSWVELKVPPTNGKWIGDIAIDENNPNVIYVTYSGDKLSALPAAYEVSKVDYTQSATNPIITDLSYNLPATYIASIVLEHGSNGGIYVATDLGVYYTNSILQLNPASAWILLGTGLPNVGSTGLEINYKANKIRIGTDGRGVWQHDLYCPTNYDLNFSGNSLTYEYDEAQHNITSMAVVNSGSNVTYRAGNQVVLNTGFQALNGSIFNAFIHPCSGGTNSFYKPQIEADDVFFRNEEQEEQADKKLFNQDIPNDVSIFPNPTTGKLNIESRFVIYGISIYDFTGRLIMHNDKVDNNKVTVSIKGKSPGIYLVRVNGKNNYVIKKIILQ